MNWKKVIFWTIGIILGVGALAASVAFILLMVLERDNRAQTDNEQSVVESSSSNEEDFNTERVNEPVEEDTVVLADGTNGHSFISQWHTFYNNTLGWGKLSTASYSEQKEAADSILSDLVDVEVQNDEIANDLDSIIDLATIVSTENDRDAMRNLHRYFHDLDIYFNGYDYNQTFGLTEFTGE